MIKLMDILREMEYPMAKGDELQSLEGYAGYKGKIIWMTPDKFLNLAYPLSKDEREEWFQDLEKKMKAGMPIDPLALWINPQRRKVVGHEGRHRATVAKRLGIEKVPVLVIVSIWDKRVPKWTKAQHSFVDKADFNPEWR